MEIRSQVALWFLAASVAACANHSGGPSNVTVGDPSVPAGEEGDVVITLHREGGGGELTIPFATRDDSATGDADYASTVGKVHWDDGDMDDKTLVVSLVDDVTIESPETFMIQLGEPSNDSVVDRSDFMITINDDDHPGDSFAVTSAGRLMHFDRAQPGRFTWAVGMTGLAAGEKVVSLDMRPADGKLYGLTDSAKLYTIDPMTGAATLKSVLVADPSDTTSPFTGLSGTELGIDFNPITDRLRLTSNTGQNLRIDVDTGKVITDPAISGQTTGYAALAHNNNIAASCRTRLYAIDVTGNRFVMQSPNEGTTEGAGGLRLVATASAGFDIYTDEMGKDAAYAMLTVEGQVGMYKIDLGTGQAEAVRAKAGPLDPDEVPTSFALGVLPPTTPAMQQLGELFGVTATQVVSFNRENPEKLCSAATISGLEPTESILDLDMQPSTGVLYVLTKIGSAGTLHRVDPYGGTLSPAIPVGVALSGSAFGIDFIPFNNAALRIVSDTGQNIRVTDIETGAATADPALNGAGTSATGAAYTDAALGAGTATLYVIDPASDHLRIQNANTGTLVDVGPLGTNITTLAGFDIDGRNNTGFVASTVSSKTQLHTIDVATGALSASLGTVGTATPLLGMTRATPEVFFYGVTTDGKLVRFDVNDPSKVVVVSDPMRMVPTDLITGLGPNEYFVSVDFRLGQNMYGLTNLGAIYSLNASLADANKLGALHADPTDTSAPFTTLSGTRFDVDFEPTGDIPLRIVSDAEQNLSVTNLNPPTVFTDNSLTSASAVDIVGAAYTNSFAGATSTTLYVIDAASSQLMIQSPSGALSAVGPLGVTGTLQGFDINGGNNGIALAAMQRTGEPFSRLYRIDLETGAATEIGNGIGSAPLRSMAVYLR